MRPTPVLDRPSPAWAPHARDLLVLWQHPISREIIPIGRFGHDGETYTFSYTRAASAIADFRPLPGLGDLRRHYTGTRLPAAFEQRIMETDRPDFAEYMESIGLDPSAATPWEQIVESGGTRAGDTLQFMQVPTVSAGRAHARFFANGVRHVPGEDRMVAGRNVRVTTEDQERALRALSVGDTVLLEAEIGNPTDACATLITTDGVPVGWVPRALSAGIRQLIDVGPVSATVARIGGPSTPPHMRLVIDLDVPVPAGFEFDPDGRWEPLASNN